MAKIQIKSEKLTHLGGIFHSCVNYVDASFTGFNYRYFSLPLRGREVMATVKYKF